ncbi:multifunctional protein ADE2 isoform X1 [Cyprinodon tularosa]|uniref:multifunctional protein ADE2 isoform X1 n=1 Tax=Cyprinodon tularosa TaxID=77115 RepID=UPI0018E289F0|nr:multifunctional protein ADE2 isoform X1 [Cyprinodon tularosa]
MERQAERQRREDREVVEEKGSMERLWGEEEVLALVSVWNEAGAQHGAESRATFELISERLRRLSVVRSWRECQAKSRSLGLQSSRADAAAGTSASYGLELEGKPVENTFLSSVSVPMNEAGTIARMRTSLPLTPNVSEEGGRHWTDEEVRALLCVWADQSVRERLRSTLRNKCIFQEMARQMQRKFGVVRNWKQCRTKYKNLKYDYKTAKNAHAAAGSSAGGPGRYMKFFEEVEAILLNKGLENGTEEMQKRLYNGDTKAGQMQTPPGNTRVMTASDNEIIIEIEDDDNSDDYDIDGDVEGQWKGTEAHLTQPDSPSSDQFHVVTVSDTGRNWSDQEVQALIQVWSDKRICKQLESSTRKRDIFVQISKRLMQQGIERDWKQCHTKYKNLKYLYRSLQRSKTDEAERRRLMRFYDEVDAIMTHTPLVAAEAVNSSPLAISQAREENCWADVHLAKTNRGEAMDEETCHSDSVPIAVNEDLRLQGVQEHQLDQHHTPNSPSETPAGEDGSFSVKRGKKRKAVDQDCSYQKAAKQLNAGRESVTVVEAHCKEEQEHVPIIKIKSVCSMAQSNSSPKTKNSLGSTETMASSTDLNIGQKLNEGKTKQIFELLDQPGLVLVQSKDQITAGNAVRKDQMEGKAAIANKTTCCVFKLLQESGIKTAFVKQHSETAFIAAHCEMIPIEWVCRRVATGSFLKRNPGVKEGYRFSPLKMEMFFKDDANNDPQWSEEQLLAAKFTLAGLTIGQCEVDIMSRSTVAIFEILEKAWATQNCTLVDMKIEFGVNVKTGEIVLADVIDNDSWRLWPAGDRSQQKDKQVYRDLKEVTPEAMQMVKRNFEWVSERVQLLLEPQSSGRVVVLMGSTSDIAHCEKIKKACTSYGLPCILRVTSAHKGPDETLRIKAEYEGDGVPTIFVAVAGRSNGLGPVMSGNTAYPVINCPPLTPDWGAQDVWSSLRLPSGLGCSTILSPDAAAQFAAQIIGLSNHLVWCKLRASMLNTWVSLKLADQKLQACSL